MGDPITIPINIFITNSSQFISIYGIIKILIITSSIKIIGLSQ